LPAVKKLQNTASCAAAAVHSAPARILPKPILYFFQIYRWQCIRPKGRARRQQEGKIVTEDFLVLKLLSLGIDSSHCLDLNHFVDGHKCIKGYVPKLQRFLRPSVEKCYLRGLN
jgi:hypothetical protein